MKAFAAQQGVEIWSIDMWVEIRVSCGGVLHGEL